jgi:hypothetical protein
MARRFLIALLGLALTLGPATASAISLSAWRADLGRCAAAPHPVGIPLALRTSRTASCPHRRSGGTSRWGGFPRHGVPSLTVARRVQQANGETDPSVSGAAAPRRLP